MKEKMNKLYIASLATTLFFANVSTNVDAMQRLTVVSSCITAKIMHDLGFFSGFLSQPQRMDINNNNVEKMLRSYAYNLTNSSLMGFTAYNAYNTKMIGNPRSFALFAGGLLGLMYFSHKAGEHFGTYIPDNNIPPKGEIHITSEKLAEFEKEFGSKKQK